MLTCIVQQTCPSLQSKFIAAIHFFIEGDGLAMAMVQMKLRKSALGIKSPNDGDKRDWDRRIEKIPPPCARCSQARHDPAALNRQLRTPGST